MLRFFLLASIAIFHSNLACTAFSQDAHKSRTWTSNKGHKVTATLVENGADTIQLKKDTGKIIELKVSRLSSADQKYLSKLREREQEKIAPVASSKSERVWGKPEVTDSDRLKLGEEFKLINGSSMSSPFKRGFHVHNETIRWKNHSGAKVSVVNRAKDSVEKIEGWSFSTIEEKDRKELIKIVNQFIEDDVKGTHGQFSIQTTIPDWLEIEGTGNNSSEKEVSFRMFLYFGRQPHIFRATADSTERLDFLVKSIGTLSEESEEEAAYPEEFRAWKGLNGDLLVEDATLKDIKRQQVTLVTKSGEEIQLSLFKFSREDRRFINDTRAEKAHRRSGRTDDFRRGSERARAEADAMRKRFGRERPSRENFRRERLGR